MRERCELQSDRLLLRPVTTAEGRLLHDLWTTAGVRRFLWDDTIIPWERTAAMVEQSAQLFAERRIGLWAVWLLEKPAVLSGFGAMWPLHDPPEVELVYGVAEPLWNRGYATEIGAAIMGYCFTRLRMPVVRASVDWGNDASMRVLEKLGFEFVRRAVVGGLDTVFYQRKAPEAS